MKKYLLSFSATLILIVSSPFIQLAQDWSAVGGFDATGAAPEKVIEFEGDLIVCAEFTTVNGEDLGHIVRWDGTAWTQMGTGITGDFKCIGVANGELFVGGILISEDQVNQQSIYKWDGTNWVGTGDAIDVGYPSALTEWNGQLVAAVNGSGVNNSIKKYNGGTSWTQIGADISDPDEFYQDVNALVAHNDTLFIAGTFDNVGIDENAQRIAKFDGENWVSVNFPMPGPDLPNPNYGEVNVLEVHNGRLFAGGQFTHYGGVQWSRPCIAYYEGGTWTAFDIDEEFPSVIHCLESDGENLFCGGEIGYFDEGDLTTGVVVFDEADENNFINLNFYNVAQNYVEVTNLTLLEGSIYATGSFAFAGSADALGVAKFNGVMPQPTAINENNTITYQRIGLSPNPSTDYLTIEVPTQGRITIYNSVGSMVFDADSRNITSIDLAQWDNGVYYIELTTETNRFTEKFIKI